MSDEPEVYVQSDEPTPMRSDNMLWPHYCRFETRMDYGTDKVLVRVVWFDATGQRISTGGWR